MARHFFNRNFRKKLQRNNTFFSLNGYVRKLSLSNDVEIDFFLPQFGLVFQSHLVHFYS